MHYLAEYQSFDSTQALNRAVYEHIKRNSFDLNETERLTLKKIARYAVKFSGAAHLKAETLAELIGKSVKTARRALNKLVKLEIIKKVATTRKVNGGHGANILVVLPVGTASKNNNDQSIMTSRQESEEPSGTRGPDPKLKNEPSNPTKQFNYQNLDTAVIPAEALKNTIPEVIYTAMSRYFEADEIYKYYGVLLRAKASVDRNILLEDHAICFTQVWHATIMKAKRGGIKNFDKYLYTGFRQAAIEIKRRTSKGKMMEQFKALFE
ncbi:helix-turn-helix domain-containing protein [Bacillus velezensis]|uniref:helix-turn-helix domain-containing protein n=1 Tax=Bacillus TaxID=1386 RepID=UPI001C52A60F|nr:MULTISPECIES: helix-turn-helix domain-containing protein [Bacillus amyloliquefaciens group]QXP95473.1 helix-turn-helix domain-containing protein [Bacillus velezensis]QXP99272.1 helix-turn-helix domain-containing protein [Bacillus velezensis]UHH01299.1 helix-turn-helix domain-containing protein [Bacillus amyloliquefaciens]ULR21047.1 helix-turn-helix domain-containing protein [Bacillus velezensis]UVW07790.1 helix-turn-helix domain-containing protein [Bacillus velezensis]